MEIIKLPNGITLDPNNEEAQNLIRYAKRKGMYDVKAFLVIDKKGYQEYLLAIANKPEYSSQRLKDIISHIDSLVANKELVGV
jgi:hypothetical protein